MAEDTFGASIRARAAVLGIVDEHGRATPVRLADFLSKRWQIEIKPRTVESWLANERAPRVGRLLRLLQALNIHGADRDRVLALAAEVEQDEAPPIDPEGDLDPVLDPAGHVVVPTDVRGERGLDGPASCVDERGMDVVDDVELTVKDFSLSDPPSPT